MKKIIATLIMGSCFAWAFGQNYTVLSDDFESGSGSWFNQGPTIVNQYIVNACAGNGTSAAGSNSAYITAGGAGVGCDPGGVNHFGYEDAPLVKDSVRFYHLVDATCLSTVQLDFDYRIEGDPSNDFAYVVYSTDGGTTWIRVGSEMSNQTDWTSSSLTLPASLAGTSFLLGFNFVYDNSLSTTLPFAFDNVVVQGNDNSGPTVVCKPNVIEDADPNCEYELDGYGPFVTNLSDNCSDSLDITISSVPALNSVLTQINTPITIEITVTDEAGNSSTCSSNLTIEDITAPVVTCPADTNIYLNQNCEYVLEDWTSQISIQENCTPQANLIIAQIPALPATFNTPNTSQNIEFTVEDESGNIGTCSFNLLFADTTKPTIDCPSDTTLILNATCNAGLGNYVALVTASDNCNSSLTVTQNPIPGSNVNGAGTTQLVTMEVNDGFGNSNTCVFNAVAIDTIKPILACPANTTQNADANCETVLNDYTGSALLNSDNCSATTITQSPAIGATITGDNNVITLTSTDASGNFSTCTFEVDVIDVTDPVVSCPNDTTIPTNASCLAAIPDYTALASVTDNCAITSPVFTQTAIPPGPLFGVGNSSVITISVEDDAGNTGTCSFNAVVIDTMRPVVTCPTNSSVNGDANCEFSAIDYTALTSTNDNCSAVGDITLTQSIPMGDPLSGGVNTITITATDQVGNANTCDFEVEVIDVINPVANCPSDTAVYSNGDCDAILTDYTHLVTPTDNCSDVSNLVVTQSPAPGINVAVSQLLTMTVTDEAGLTNTCTFTVSKADSTKPVVVCPSDINVNADANCDFTIDDYLPQASATDNCSQVANLVFSQSPLNGNTGNGLTPITIFATDEAGNVGECTFNLIPTDVTPPVVNSCPVDDTLYLDANCEVLMPDYTPQMMVTDNCGGIQYSQSIAFGTLLNAGTNAVTISATDPGNNSVDCNFNVVVLDTITPTIVCPNDTTSCIAVVNYDLPTINDNCSGATLNQIDLTGFTTGDEFPVGLTVLEYEVEDAGGNTATCDFRVTILEYSDTANIITDEVSLCDTITTIIEADELSSGLGTWEVISGVGTVSTVNSHITAVNGIGLGEMVIAWTVTNGSGCPTSSDTMTLNLYEMPTIANVGFDMEACADTFTLNGNFVIKGTGMWTHVEGGAQYDDVNLHNTDVYDLQEGLNHLVWTISNGSCPATSDTVEIIKYGQPTVANILTNDTTICDTVDVFSIIAEQPDFGEGGWAVIQGVGAISDFDSTQIDVTLLGGGENKLVWVVRNDVCSAISDTISITVELCGDFDEIPNLLTPNFDGKNDVWEIPYLNDFHPDCIVQVYNRWGVKIFESEGYEKAWDVKYKGEIVPAGAYFYTINLGNGERPKTGSLTVIR